VEAPFYESSRRRETCSFPSKGKTCFTGRLINQKAFKCRHRLLLKGSAAGGGRRGTAATARTEGAPITASEEPVGVEPEPLIGEEDLVGERGVRTFPMRTFRTPSQGRASVVAMGQELSRM